MNYDRELLASLVRSPRESLDVELKAWIDPTSTEGIAKIARACIALRNNNGGYLVIGIDNSGKHDSNVPPDPRGLFHGDRVQAIVSKYASHNFEVAVEFVDYDAVSYPIVCVPAGIETPVAAKAGLNASDNTPLVRPDAVYVRSLNSNNTVSTTAARWQDWDRLVKTCFDNREADIGAFVRRHLSDLNLEGLADAFRGALVVKAPDPSPLERAVAYLDYGLNRFHEECSQRNIEIANIAVREAAIIIAGDVPAHTPSEAFLNRLQVSKPRHTGWTPWVDSQGGHDARDRPYVAEGAWEALLIDWSNPLFGAHLDFWRIDPKGAFYCLRGFEDDLPNPRAERPKPGTQLDFLLQISRTAEIISIALSFAHAMGCQDDTTALAFAFRWTGLRGRHLTSWVHPERTFYSRGESRPDAIVSQTTVPLDAPQSAIAGHAEAIVAPVFELFGGMRFESSVIQGIVNETLSRRF